MFAFLFSLLCILDIFGYSEEADKAKELYIDGDEDFLNMLSQEREAILRIKKSKEKIDLESKAREKKNIDNFLAENDLKKQQLLEKDAFAREKLFEDYDRIIEENNQYWKRKRDELEEDLLALQLFNLLQESIERDKQQPGVR